jgi:hypothetical protein
MTKRLCELVPRETTIFDVPPEVFDHYLHVHARFLLARTSRHFQRLIVEPATVYWTVIQRCHPCGSLERLHECQCPKRDIGYVKPGKLRVYGTPIFNREVTHSVCLLYSEKQNDFVFRTAAKFSFHWAYEEDVSDLFAIHGHNSISAQGVGGTWFTTFVFDHIEFRLRKQ